MVRVLHCGRFRVYIYKEIGGQHHEPHCHVYWPDGDCSVGLADLAVLDGDPMPDSVFDVLNRNRDLLWTAWHSLNDERR